MPSTISIKLTTAANTGRRMERSDKDILFRPFFLGVGLGGLATELHYGLTRP